MIQPNKKCSALFATEISEKYSYCIIVGYKCLIVHSNYIDIEQRFNSLVLWKHEHNQDVDFVITVRVINSGVYEGYIGSISIEDQEKLKSMILNRNNIDFEFISELTNFKLKISIAPTKKWLSPALLTKYFYWYMKNDTILLPVNLKEQPKRKIQCSYSHDQLPPRFIKNDILENEIITFVDDSYPDLNKNDNIITHDTSIPIYANMDKTFYLQFTYSNLYLWHYLVTVIFQNLKHRGIKVTTYNRLNNNYFYINPAHKLAQTKISSVYDERFVVYKPKYFKHIL